MTDACKHCLKAPNKKNCKQCPNNPIKYLLTFTVQCTDCPELKDAERTCKPYPYDECPRADQVLELLRWYGVLKMC